MGADVLDTEHGKLPELSIRRAGKTHLWTGAQSHSSYFCTCANSRRKKEKKRLETQSIFKQAKGNHTGLFPEKREMGMGNQHFHKELFTECLRENATRTSFIIPTSLAQNSLIGLSLALLLHNHSTLYRIVKKRIGIQMRGFIYIKQSPALPMIRIPFGEEINGRGNWRRMSI